MHEIELKPSRLLGLLLLGMTALALAAIGTSALPGGVQLALAVVVAGLGMRSWQRTRCRETLRMTADARLQCKDEQGRWCDVEVLGDSLVTPAIIVLRYRTRAGLRSLTLLPDSAADPAQMRRLRVLLRWAGRTRSDTASPDAG